MAWEEIKKSSRGGPAYGPDWFRVPCVAVNKTGLTLNEPAVETFGYTNIRQVHLLFDSQSRKIGIKKAEEGGFALRDGHGKSNRATRSVGCPRLTKQIPDCTGRAYRAHLNQTDRLVEVDLAPSNAIKR